MYESITILANNLHLYTSFKDNNAENVYTECCNCLLQINDDLCLMSKMIDCLSTHNESNQLRLFDYNIISYYEVFASSIYYLKSIMSHYYSIKSYLQIHSSLYQPNPLWKKKVYLFLMSDLIQPTTLLDIQMKRKDLY